MRIVKYLLTALLVIGFASLVEAAPVGLTSEADLNKAKLFADNNIGISISAILDSVGNVNVDVDDGEFEMTAIVARLGLSVLERVNFYADIGQAGDMEFNWTDAGDKVQTKFEDETLWGVGVNGLIYRWNNGLEIGAGASYRTADMPLDSAQVAGISYKKSQITSIRDGEFSEVQVAFECAWKTEYFIPYAGLKYSNVEVDADFTADGTVRKATGKESDQNVGVFVGLSIAPKIDALGEQSDRLAINVEGRFIDEEAVSVGVSYKF
jgi:opacity protein-like surface antigen